MRCKVTVDTSHYPKEVPFEVPEGWALSTINDLFTINPKNIADDSTVAAFVPMASISDGFSDSFKYEERCWRDVKSGFTHFADGDVAVAKISPCLENRKSFVAKALPNGIGAGTTELFVFRSRHILPDYTLLFFKSDYFISACVGTFNGVVGQQRAARNVIEEMMFPIPPVPEQSRIVEKVEELFGEIDEIERGRLFVKANIEAAKSRILDLAIHGKLVPQDPTEEPAIELLKRINPAFTPSDNLHYDETLPTGWAVTPLHGICNTINGLWKGTKAPLINVGVIRNANFTKDFTLDYSKIEYIDVEQKSFEKRNLENGDIIVEKSGGSDFFPVGRSILYIGENKRYSFSNFTMSLRIANKDYILPEYLYYVLQYRYRRGDMKQLQTQTTGLHNLLTDKFMSMDIPIPPTSEQARIAKAIKYLFGLANRIRDLVNDSK